MPGYLTAILHNRKITRMGFIKNIRSAIFDPEFYQRIKNGKLSDVFKYFFLLTLLLSIINTILLSQELLIRVPAEIKNFVSQSVNSYPPNLEVSVNDGQASTNAEEPFFVPFPETDNEYAGINNLLVIDTKTPFSVTQFEQYKTLAWLTKDSLFFQNREFDQRSIPLTDVENFTVSRQFIDDLANKINPWLSFVGPLLLVIVFIGMLIGFIFNLVYMLFLAVLVYFLSAIFKWRLSYKTAFITAIYASTLAFIVDLILFNTGLFTGFFGFPFLFTLIALCVATINFQNIDKPSR
jgi:hypothetical protein